MSLLRLLSVASCRRCDASLSPRVSLYQGKLPLRKTIATFRCEPCGDTFHGESQYTTHVAGKRHAKRVQLLKQEEAAKELSGR